MKGYKVFNPDWTCRGFQYEVGKTFVYDDAIKICENGFHFCKKLADCFNYYKFDSNNKVAEVEAMGNIVERGDKIVTDKIRVVKELSWHEVLDICNTGENNSGDRNSGDRNSGNGNSGNGNSGNENSGNMNTGDRNSGNMNTGDRNSGDRNSGDWNSTNHSTGFFNTVEQSTIMFNKPTTLSYNKIISLKGMKILKHNFHLTEWVCGYDMTDKEKEENPTYKTTEGYLKKYTYFEACKNMWDSLNDEEKQAVKDLPNFDRNIFKEITGIDIEG